MSIFSELLPKINEISNAFTKNFNDDLKVAFDCFDKFEEEFQNGRSKTREKAQKDKHATTTLQIINEDEVEINKTKPGTRRQSNKSTGSTSRSSNESGNERAAKKRSKNEVDGIFSPDQDKRLKRNASVKAQGIISKQVNVNLTQKLRRENSTDSVDKNQSSQSARGRRRKDDEKENLEPSVPAVQIKQEKMSLPPEPEPEPEPMDTETSVQVKQESNMDGFAMPPPAAPIPKPRKGVPKEKPQAEETGEEEPSGRRRTTRTKKQTDTAPAPASRSTRSSSRARRTDADEAPPAPAPPTAPPAPPVDARPKRTRAKKKLSTATNDTDVTQSSQDSLPASPAEKPRPKRTRRVQKAAENEQPKPVEQEPIAISPKDERTSQQKPSSPILPQKEIKIPKNKKDKTNPDIDLSRIKDEVSAISKEKELSKSKNALKESAQAKSVKELDQTKTSAKELAQTKTSTKELAQTKTSAKELAQTKTSAKELAQTKSVDNDQVDNILLDETRVLNKPGEMDQTMVLSNGVYNHAPITPKNRNMNETVVLERCDRETMVLDKAHHAIMDSTVVIEKGPKITNLTDDNSLLTDDSDAQDIENTPPKKDMPQSQPQSAVKEKVQQFEELATRVTRTKTRAMAKKEEEKDETQTPPDKVSKAVLSSETLSKMNSLIFNGKPSQMSSSASKPRATAPVGKPPVPSTTSKLSALSKAREAADECMKREDARRKKEAMLEAKREQQKRKREEKMAAAAAARSAAERDRRAAIEAAAREREERQAHADQGKVERLREAERKKQDLARKVAETEERRKAEEAARQQRLAEEQRRAMEQRRKQIEEQEAMKREAAIMAKEIEQKQREYIEKQKKQRHEDKMHTPFKTPGTPGGYHAPPIDPVYMEDGFQYLNSDEEEEPVDRPIPEWSTSRARRAALSCQARVPAALTARLFSVRVHSPDLRAIFPNIERARLKRTSSAVWRTPPHLPPLRE